MGGSSYFGTGALLFFTVFDLYRFNKKGELYHLSVIKPYIKIKSLVGIDIPHIFKKGNFEFYDGENVKMKLHNGNNSEIVDGSVYKEYEGVLSNSMWGDNLMIPHYTYYLLHNNPTFKGSYSARHQQSRIHSTFFNIETNFLGYKYSWKLRDTYTNHSEVLIEDISHEFSKYKLK